MDAEQALPLAAEWASEVADPNTTHRPYIDAVHALVAEVRRLTAEPNLAAASSRELLEELQRRGAVRAVIDGEPQWAVPKLIADVAASILDELPDALLDYRAVGS